MTTIDKRMIAANMLMGDLEFASDVAPFFGPFYQSENIDPSVARLVPGNIPMETAEGRMKGFYIPEQMSDNELRQLQSRAQLYAFSPRKGYFPEAQVERDTVYAVGPDASPEVWAHEFRHRTLSRGPRSARNRLSPRPSLISGSLRARVRMTSPQPLVMNRLTPVSRHWPSSSCQARRPTACKSLPASGSVKAIAPVYSPRANGGRY